MKTGRETRVREEGEYSGGACRTVPKSGMWDFSREKKKGHGRFVSPRSEKVFQKDGKVSFTERGTKSLRGGEKDEKPKQKKKRESSSQLYPTGTSRSNSEMGEV